ncbi:hypothetical protein PIB30_079368, partial [Stylosanthes scabra]|nr:hypothetical protein [Stylosanthes scabra]
IEKLPWGCKFCSLGLFSDEWKNGERKLEEQKRRKLEHSVRAPMPRRRDSRLGGQTSSPGEKRRKEACGARNEVWKQFCPEVPFICLDAGAYAYTIMMQTTPRHPLIKPRRGPYPYLSTDRRGSPRICVDHQPLPKSTHA